jgi:hypothetical protein
MSQNSIITAMRGVVTGFIVCVMSLSLPASEEEFVGPFASWRDLKRDYGGIGDGKTDDTKALQRGLDELIKHKKSCVLYIPAGTYRLTATIRTERKEHTDCQGVAVIGEDPSSTILLWDSPVDGTMFQWDAWYSKISRLTFEGKGQAGTGLRYGPAFSTCNETSDLVFRNIKNALVFGRDTRRFDRHGDSPCNGDRWRSRRRGNRLKRHKVRMSSADYQFQSKIISLSRAKSRDRKSKIC